MPQETKSHAAHSDSTEATQGLRAEASDPAALAMAIDMAVKYRGDVTITLVGGQTIAGYVFDRRSASEPANAIIRLIPQGAAEKVSVEAGTIDAIEFTGRDTAADRSFQTQVRKYVEKKLAGEAANLLAEPLDEGAASA